MRRLGFSFLLLFAGLPVVFHGQGPPPPKPIIETELRDNTTKIRAIELERLKREAHKPLPDEDAAARELRFRETKKRFEDIQKLQGRIIRTYTTGKTINYARIGESASDMSDSAKWLDENLFGTEPDEMEPGKVTRARREDVRDLIVELDGAIGKFVESPVFKPSNVLEKSDYQEAQKWLRRVILISRRLAAAAGHQNPER